MTSPAEAPVGPAKRLAESENGVPTEFVVVASATPGVVAEQPRRRGRPRKLHYQCQVEGCESNLNTLRSYHQRYRVCDKHMIVPSVLIDGTLKRFCQQCGRFQELPAFDGDQRSCRARLQRHAQRRRRGGGSISPSPEDERGAPRASSSEEATENETEAAAYIPRHTTLRQQAISQRVGPSSRRQSFHAGAPGAGAAGPSSKPRSRKPQSGVHSTLDRGFEPARDVQERRSPAPLASLAAVGQLARLAASAGSGLGRFDASAQASRLGQSFSPEQLELASVISALGRRFSAPAADLATVPASTPPRSSAFQPYQGDGARQASPWSGAGAEALGRAEAVEGGPETGRRLAGGVIWPIPRRARIDFPPDQTSGAGEWTAQSRS